MTEVAMRSTISLEQRGWILVGLMAVSNLVMGVASAFDIDFDVAWFTWLGFGWFLAGAVLYWNAPMTRRTLLAARSFWTALAAFMLFVALREPL